MLKNLPANAGDRRNMGSFPGMGSPGGRCGNLLHYSHLEDLMDRGAWRATVHKVTKSWTQLRNWTTGIHTAGMNKLHWLNTDSLLWKEPLIHGSFWTLTLTSENSLFIPFLGHIWTGEWRPSTPWGVCNDPLLS